MQMSQNVTMTRTGMPNSLNFQSYFERFINLLILYAVDLQARQNRSGVSSWRVRYAV